MTGIVSGYTTSYNLAKLNFDSTGWDTYANANMDDLDVIINSIIGFVAATPWKNSTAYTAATSKVIDSTTGTLYLCNVNHTSAASPTTFATDRTDNPSYWSIYNNPVNAQGTWLTATDYKENTWVVLDNQYALCLVDHTSGVFATDVAADKWIIVADLSSSVTSASTSATNASTSATNAATSETNAATSETNAATSASTATTQASNAATSASTATTQASNASTSASTATTQASDASTSASTATTQASNASTSATTASTQAGIATTKAAEAAASAVDAAASAASIDLASPVPIGNTTPNTGAFTTLTITGTVNFGGASSVQLGVATATSLADASGSVRTAPQSGSAKTTSYQLVAGDTGKFIEVGSGGSITVPDATFAAGDIVTIFNNTSGNITLTMSITTAYIAGTDSDKATMTLATRGLATILFVSGTVCAASGNLT